MRPWLLLVPLGAAAALLAVALPAAAEEFTDPVGDPQIDGSCSLVCDNGPDPSLDLERLRFSTNGTHLLVTLATATGPHRDVPLSAPPMYHSYLFFDVDGHTWEVVARDHEPFRLVKDARMTGGAIGGPFDVAGEDRSRSITATWDSAPNRYAAAIDLRAFARAAGPPAPMQVRAAWVELYGHKGNPATYHDRLPDHGAVDTGVRFTVVLPQRVSTAVDGLWRLTLLDQDGVGVSAATRADDLHVAYIRTVGTPTGDAGLYAAARHAGRWTFQRLGPAGAANWTATAAAGNVTWVLSSPKPGALEAWHGPSPWWHEPVWQEHAWDTSRSPILAAHGRDAFLLARDSEGLQLLRTRNGTWLGEQAFPGAVDGRLAVDGKGVPHVAWIAAAEPGQDAPLQYQTAADGWEGHALPILVHRLDGMAPLALAAARNGTLAVAWGAFDFASDGSPGLWVAPLSNATLGQPVLLSRPVDPREPDTVVEAGFGLDGALHVAHGFHAATAWTVLRPDGTSWTGGFLPRLQPTLALVNASLEIAYGTSPGAAVAWHEAPLATLFHPVAPGEYVAAQPPLAAEADAPAELGAVAGAAKPSPGPILIPLALVGALALRRR